MVPSSVLTYKFASSLVECLTKFVMCSHLLYFFQCLINSKVLWLMGGEAWPGNETGSVQRTFVTFFLEHLDICILGNE